MFVGVLGGYGSTGGLFFVAFVGSVASFLKSVVFVSSTIS